MVAQLLQKNTALCLDSKIFLVNIVPIGRICRHPSVILVRISLRLLLLLGVAIPHEVIVVLKVEILKLDHRIIALLQINQLILGIVH